MSFFVGRMHKLKSCDIRGMQYHNQRERPSKTNTDIDRSKTHLNYDLVNNGKIDYKKKIEERIKEGVKTKRKIRKDAVLCNQWIITSDRGFFEGLSEEEERRFFREAYQWFCNRYGKENVVFATVHRDEHTPHLHLGVVPITRDGRLSSKDLFNPRELKRIQDEFPRYMKKRGFNLERGIPNKQKHIEPVKYKNKKMIELGEKIERWLASRVKMVRRIDRRDKRVNQIRVEERGLFKKDRVTLSKSDWEFVKGEARRAEVLDIELDRMDQRVKFLMEQVEMLKRDRDKARRFDQLSKIFGRRRLERVLEQRRTKSRIKERGMDLGMDLEI